MQNHWFEAQEASIIMMLYYLCYSFFPFNFLNGIPKILSKKYTFRILELQKISNYRHITSIMYNIEINLFHYFLRKYFISSSKFQGFCESFMIVLRMKY